MKVKIDNGLVRFRDIDLGSLFCMDGKELYVRCELIRPEPAASKYNAVKIRDGVLVYVGTDALVKEVKSITCEV